ncbi:MAG: hypothetical protein AMXMBFR47_22760 [Planctomycetota bacterium]
MKDCAVRIERDLRRCLLRTNIAVVGLVFSLAVFGCKKAPPPAAARTDSESDRTVQASTATTAQNPEPPGEWGVVQRRTLQQFTPAVGSFRARQTTSLGPQVAGRVLDVLVDVGVIVQTGQELVRLDPELFQIEVEQRSADLETSHAKAKGAEETLKTLHADVQVAKAALAEAELEHNRMKNLWEKPSGETPSIPKQRYDIAFFALEQAKARHRAAESRVSEQEAKVKEMEAGVKQAEEAVRHAQERLDETIIRAPYHAIVTKRLVDPGEPVTATPITRLLEVQDIARLYLEFSLPQELLSVVRTGTPVTFGAEGVDSAESSGEVATVFPAIDEATRSFRCRTIVENTNQRFRPGMLCRVQVISREAPDALAVPRAALRSAASGWKVIVSNDGHPVERIVQIGLLTDEWAEVKDGLRDGDKVLLPSGR